jgi:hypothetical protein
MEFFMEEFHGIPWKISWIHRTIFARVTIPGSGGVRTHPQSYHGEVQLLTQVTLTRWSIRWTPYKKRELTGSFLFFIHLILSAFLIIWWKPRHLLTEAAVTRKGTQHCCLSRATFTSLEPKQSLSRSMSAPNVHHWNFCGNLYAASWQACSILLRHSCLYKKKMWLEENRRLMLDKLWV